MRQTQDIRSILTFTHLEVLLGRKILQNFEKIFYRSSLIDKFGMEINDGRKRKTLTAVSGVFI